MRLVAYTRVSTGKQVEEGYGLDVQRDAITRWAKREGHRIVRWCADEGVSGTLTHAERPGLTCAFEAIESGAAEGLITYKLDRLARVLTVQEAALAYLWRLGGRAFTTDAGEVLQDDPEDPMRTAMRQMMGVFAQLERASLVARMRKGRRLKAERGGYAYGSPRYGQQAGERRTGERKERVLVVDDAEQAAIARIVELHRGGASLRSIAATLDAEGHKPKRASRWHPYSVKLMLDRAE
jgi:DNA invertase Pin-like site-specific DNA recombinase